MTVAQAPRKIILILGVASLAASCTAWGSESPAFGRRLRAILNEPQTLAAKLKNVQQLGPSRRGKGFEVRRLEQQDWRLTPFPNVRWVSPEELAPHKEETDVKILTAVLLKHTKPGEAARRLSTKLPHALEIGVAAENMLILFQGTGGQVHETRERLRKIDVKR